MNKYELALVVSANVEDEVRTATIEKVNELITRFGDRKSTRLNSSHPSSSRMPSSA